MKIKFKNVYFPGFEGILSVNRQFLILQSLQASIDGHRTSRNTLYVRRSNIYFIFTFNYLNISHLYSGNCIDELNNVFHD